MRKDWQHFFNNVKNRLTLYDWRLEYDCVDIEGMCYSNTKTIAIGRKVKNWKYLMLHEFAHALTNRFCNMKHNTEFYKTFRHLTKKFLSQGLEERDIKAWQIYTKDGFKGYYSLKYQERK